MPLLLAADVGGTKTLLSLFERADRRPRSVRLQSYPTTAFSRFTAVLDVFAQEMLD